MLIERARKRFRPGRPKGIPVREAAAEAGLSPSRWGQIASGYQSNGGVRTPVTGQPHTVARMARAVDVTPEQLEEAGRPDAADELRVIIEATAHEHPEEIYSPPVDAVYEILSALPPEAQQEVIRRLQDRASSSGAEPHRHRDAG